MQGPEPLVTVDYVAVRLAISKPRVYELVREGVIPHIRLKRQIRFARGAIEDFLQSGGESLAGGSEEESERPVDVQL